MKKLFAFALMTLLLFPCLTGCLFAGLLLDDTSSTKVVPKIEEEPEAQRVIDAQAVMAVDIFDWNQMSDDEKFQWASDVGMIWNSYDSTLEVPTETILSDVTALLAEDSEQANIFDLACRARSIDPNIYYPQTEDSADAAPAQEISSNPPADDQGIASSYNIQADASALRYDIFDWQLMSEADRLKLMDAFIVIWQAGGKYAVTVDKSAETLLAEVTAELQRDSEQAVIFDAACRSQGIDAEPFYNR